MKKHNNQFQFIRSSKQRVKKNATAVSFLDPSLPLQAQQAVIIPNMALFIRDVSEYGNIGAVKKRALSLSPAQLIKLAWWNKFNLLLLAKKDFATGLLLLMQIEVLKTQQARPSLYILTDQVTDLAVALQNIAILKNFNSLIQKTARCDSAFMTNNLPALIDTLAVNKISPTYIFAPFGRNGYEMNPSKAACEAMVNRMPSGKLVAITNSTDEQELRYLQNLVLDNTLTDWF